MDDVCVPDGTNSPSDTFSENRQFQFSCQLSVNVRVVGTWVVTTNCSLHLVGLAKFVDDSDVNHNSANGHIVLAWINFSTQILSENPVTLFMNENFFLESFLSCHHDDVFLN